MAERWIQKNQNERIRICSKRYYDNDIIDIRIQTKTRDGSEVLTRKGIALNIDLIPSLIDALEWALCQPCFEEEDAEEVGIINGNDAEDLASFIHKALLSHGIAVHWDFIERLVLEDPAMAKYTKWDLHCILVTRKDLFYHEGEGRFSAI